MRVLGKSFAFPAPAPSPNGRLIIDQCRTQLICVCGTSLPGRVVAHFRGALVETPLWSPNGSSVALTLSGNYTTTTAVGSVKTAALDQISSPTYIGTDDAVDAWAPDSSTILVQRRCRRGLLIGQTPCRDQAFSETVSTHQRHRLLTHDDQRWESARWTKTSLTYITPPSE